MNALDVYLGSDGDLTKCYYAALQQRGPLGIVAVNLFRAQKCSARAKVYRGGIRGKGSFRRMAYERKQWSLDNLVRALGEHAAQLGVAYGWKQDPSVLFDNEPSWVIYIDLPQGQVSFHSPSRGDGPSYQGDWDGQHRSEERIVRFCDSVFHQPDPRQMFLSQGDPDRERSLVDGKHPR